jgi:hypothetical protein
MVPLDQCQFGTPVFEKHQAGFVTRYPCAGELDLVGTHIQFQFGIPTQIFSIERAVRGGAPAKQNNEAQGQEKDGGSVIHVSPPNQILVLPE